MNLEVGNVFEGRYLVQRLIGQGNLGPVYEARDVGDGRRVAIRLIEPGYKGERLAAFDANEAMAAGRLGHPHIAQVMGVGSLEQNEQFVISSLIVGETLNGRMQRLGCLSEEGTLQLLVQLLRALSVAHASGVVHRDLTPRSIFLVPATSGDGATIQLIDFGITRLQLVSEDPETSALLLHSDVDSYQYLAPEQLSGLRELDPRCNIYSVGVVAYEAITGALPFEGSTISELGMNMLQTTPKSVERLAPQTSRQLVKLIRKAMATTPSARYHSAAEMLEAIASFSSLPSVFPPEPVTLNQATEQLTTQSTNPAQTDPSVPNAKQDDKTVIVDHRARPPQLESDLVQGAGTPLAETGEQKPYAESIGSGVRRTAVEHNESAASRARLHDEATHGQLDRSHPDERSETTQPSDTAVTDDLPGSDAPAQAAIHTVARGGVVAERPPVAAAAHSAHTQPTIAEPPPVAAARHSRRPESAAKVARDGVRQSGDGGIATSSAAQRPVGPQPNPSRSQSQRLAIAAIVLIWIAIAGIVYLALPRPQSTLSGTRPDAGPGVTPP